MDYYDKVLRPFVRRRRETLGLPANQPALVLLDTYSTHLCQPLRDRARADGTLILFIPPGFTDRLQPQDIAVNNPFKQRVTDILSAHFEGELQVAQGNWRGNCLGEGIAEVQNWSSLCEGCCYSMGMDWIDR